jgi:ubiquinone/menaquinone biosynthesis C-methylase UbiE
MAEFGPNIHLKTVSGFGKEWAAFDQTELNDEEHRVLFDRYFSIFPFETLPKHAEGMDVGCGSGRWAALVAPRVGKLHCIDPAQEALTVARNRLGDLANVQFHCASADSIPLPDASLDFGYSLGVLHHVPDTKRAIADCVQKLKPGAPFLVYLYYSFENRPTWFRSLWRASDWARRAVARLPFAARKMTTNLLAATVYLPLARLSAVAERAGRDVRNWPLSAYRHLSFYTMRTDALDRFGTVMEQRFTRAQIAEMMSSAGLQDICFHEGVPHWTAIGWRKS